MPLLPFDQEPEPEGGIGLELVCIGAIIMFCIPGLIWWAEAIIAIVTGALS